MNDKETKETNMANSKVGYKEAGKEKFNKKGDFKKGKKFRNFPGERRRLDRGKKFNDPAWYTRNKTIAEAFARFPFNYIVGNKPAGFAGPLTLPAISSFGVDWSVNTVAIDGTQTSIRDILNEVASIIYTNMRRHNAGATNDIEYVDVITSNLIAGIDILVNCVSAQRVFKVANSFSWKNRMIPRVIFKHLGLDYDDFVSRQAEYRGLLNTIIAEAMTIKVLNNYPFVNAILAEFENIFKDSDTDTGREQLLIPVKYFHHIYDATGSTANPGGCVRLMDLSDFPNSTAAARGNVLLTAPNMSTQAGVNLNNGPINYRKFEFDLQILSKQINALVTDSDFNLIQADLEKAFGETGSYLAPSTITSDETFKPIYSGEFWSMVHNGCFLPLNLISSKSTDPVQIMADTGFTGVLRLRSNRYINTVYQTHDSATGQVKLSSWVHFVTPTASSQCAGATLIDTESDDPSIEDVFIMTRYKSLFKRVPGNATGVNNPVPLEFRVPSGDETKVAYQILEAGSNFLVFGGLTTYIYFEENNYRGTEVWTEWENFNAHYNEQSIASALPLIGYEHRPLLLMTLQESTSLNPYQVDMIYNEINNLRSLNKNELYHIHETAFLSLWSLPESTNI